MEFLFAAYHLALSATRTRPPGGGGDGRKLRDALAKRAADAG